MAADPNWYHYTTAEQYFLDGLVQLEVAIRLHFQDLENSPNKTLLVFRWEDSVTGDSTIQVQGTNLARQYDIFTGHAAYSGNVNSLTIFDANNQLAFKETFSTPLDLAQLQEAVEFYEKNAKDTSKIDAIFDQYAITFNGNAIPNIFTGNALGDKIFGVGGDDTLNGAGGNDLIDGGAGNDTLNGGAGNDTFVYDGKGADTIEDFAGGAGAGDIVKITGGYPSFSHIQLHTTVGTDTVIDFGGGNQLTLKGFTGTLAADDFTFTLPAAKASAGADDLFGGAGNDTLDGLAGDDNIFGLGGDDKLTGGIGADRIDGGDGKDTVSYAASKAGVSINLTEQNADVTLSGKQTGGDAAGDQLSGIENVIGSTHDDVIIATDGVINGGAGNDTLVDGAGKDVLNGGAGDDLIVNLTEDSVADDLIGGTGNDTVDYGDTGGAGENITLSLAQQFTEAGAGIGTGGTAVTGTNQAAAGDRLSGFENVVGGGGDDKLTGDGKNNIIEGGAGADTLEGGTGNDTLSYADDLTGVAVTLNDGASAATVANGDAAGDKATGFENLLGGWGKDTLEGNSAANIIDGGANKDLLRGHDGNDTLRGGAGDDDLFGGPGADVMDGGAGFDILHYDGLSENITLTLGSKGAQTIVSSNTAKSESKGDKIANFEQVVTGDGNDSITGSDGGDIIYAGEGNDLVRGLAGADNLNGEGGTDTLTYEKSAQGVTVDLDGGFGQGGDAEGDFMSGFEILIGSKFDDTLIANVDTQKIDGGLGDDVIQSSANAQVLIGGMGVNTLSYANETNGVTVTLVAGKAADLSADTGKGNHADGDTATGFVNLTGGSGIDKLTGDSGNNIIEGGDKADIIAGGGGVDTLSYASDASGVSVVMGLAAGFGDATGDVINWTGFRNLIGGTKGDTLIGDDSANTIGGEGGNDDIQGNKGNDILNGGAGDDSIEGGDNNDTIDGGDGDDFELVGANGNDTIKGGAGEDNLGNEDENGNDFMDGGADNDVLNGGDGNDKLVGGTGDDEIYGFNGADNMDGGDGVDTLEYGVPSGPGFLTIDLQANTVTVSGTDPGLIAEAKGDKIKNFENIEADASNDTLRGTAGVNVISGGGGNDLIEGRAGADVLDGEDNGDVGDTVSYEGSGLGVTVDLTQTTQVSTGDADGDKLANFENILGSAKDDVLTGDEGANTIAGGKGNDVIQGGGSNDTLDGGAGIDTLDFSYSTPATHTVTLGLANVVTTDSGDDAVDRDSVKNFENIIGGVKNDMFVGNSMANDLRGGDGDDNIDGGLGDDTIEGGAGADTLAGGGGNDTLSYSLSTDSNTDLKGVAVGLKDDLTATVAGDDATGDTVTGFAHVTGSELDDFLIGNKFANVLRGLGGDDTLTGGGGADTLDGGVGADTADYSALGAGKSVTVTLAEVGKTATVSGSAVAEIGADKLIDIEGVRGGAGNDALTGNSDDNLFNGGAGSDTLTGGFGMDALTGGAGNDFFRYTKAAEGGDTIDDFSAGDKITIVKAGFGIPAAVKIGGTAANDFAAEYFVSDDDPAANRAHGQFLFDSLIGGGETALSWDADGTGGGAAVLIATFTDGAIITANDFDLK